jgi:hypothetical protein
MHPADFNARQPEARPHGAGPDGSARSAGPRPNSGQAAGRLPRAADSQHRPRPRGREPPMRRRTAHDRCGAPSIPVILCRLPCAEATWNGVAQRRRVLSHQATKRRRSRRSFGLARGDGAMVALVALHRKVPAGKAAGGRREPSQRARREAAWDQPASAGRPSQRA